MEMEEAYDLKPLLGELKKVGLEATEATALASIDMMLDWFEASAVLSENKYDDMALAVSPLLRGVLKDLADKIDGEKDLAE